MRRKKIKKEKDAERKERHGLTDKKWQWYFYQSILFDVYTKMQKEPHEYSGFSKTEEEN